jgi:hypothetical protein
MKLFRQPSIVICILLSLSIIYFHTKVPKITHFEYNYELSYDVTSYYIYLPMTFIYNDPGNKTTKIDSLFTKYKWSPTLYQIHHTDLGTRVPNYTTGMSYYYLPFFAIAHLWAKNTDKYPPDGFSFPYQYCISWGTILIGLIGIFLLRKFLIRFFIDPVVCLVLLWLVLGTNYFSEALNNSLQPHFMQFTLYALLLLLTDNWHRNQKGSTAFFIGIVTGWLTIARPSDILCLIIPLLYGIRDFTSFKNKIKLVRQNHTHFLLLIIGGLIPLIPQMIYWKLYTGHFIYFSYKNTEGFDFLEPHIWQVLFSFKKSLFIYTPILIVAVFGFFFLRKRYPNHFLFVTVFILCNFYLLSSWAAWWNGGSFGMRYFVQSYAVLSIPVGVAIEKLIATRFTKYILALPLLFFVFLNLFQTWQFEHYIIPDDRMTYEYYKRVFLKTRFTKEDELFQEQQRNFTSDETFYNEASYIHYTIAYYDFENVNSTPVDSSVISKKFFLSSPNSCELNENNIYYPTFRIRNKDLVGDVLDHVWIRVSFYFYTENDLKENPLWLIINTRHRDFNQKYRGYQIEKQPYELNKWNYVQFDYMTMFPYSTNDIHEIYCWYRGHSKVYIDNFKIETYARKDQYARKTANASAN